VGSGELAGSRLVDLLPVDLGASGQIDQQVAMFLTPAGRLHPILQSPRSSDPAAFWTSLPPFAGASRLTGVKPAAEVLAQTQQGSPLLVVQDLGRGRSAVVAFDSTWKWSLESDEGADAQKRFWRQLALWLTNRRPQVWVNVEKPRYLLNRLRSGSDRVQVRAGATSSGTGPQTGLTIEGILSHRPFAKPASTSRPGAQTLRWTRAGDVFENRPVIDTPGEYHIQVKASDASGPVGEAETAFVVESPDLELIDPLADLTTLRQLAESTSRQGGAYFPLERLAEVFDRLAATSQTTTTTRVERHRLVADHPWGWLTAFIILVAAEWVLRRRSGLI
jgi:hypothetical protein